LTIAIRTAGEADAAAVAAIYGHHVLSGLGTFEEVPPSVGEIGERIAAVLARGLPYLVAEDAGAVIGFAYAAPFRLRAAYRYTVEDSVYVDPAHLGRGVGKALVAQVIAACEALGLRQMVAVIGDSGNAGSIGLHRSLGFEHQGVGRSFGFKHGRWVDIVWMQRALNGGDATAPDAPGLEL
jgi:phosphinothricin acetyltransferase